jgi:3-deoxy-D-manno-octulosonic-acid transferase
MRFVYIVVAYLVAPVLCAVMLWRGFRDRSYWKGFDERFGFGAGVVGAESLWVHAVSVGEIQAAASLVTALRRRYPDLPLVVSTVTPTGAARARALFGDSVLVRYVPYDLPGSVRRFFERIRPRVAIVLETEIWPNLYNECGRRGVPLVLASARISPRSVGRYRRLVGLFGETLSHGIVIAAQSEGDAERFRSIGANPERTHVTGNIKFDIELPADIETRGAALRRRYAQERLVWVAGSTHAGEEDAALAAWEHLRSRGIDALLVIAPRHPSRFNEVAAALRTRSVPFVRHAQSEPAASGTQVVLVDTLGDLVAFYAAADVAFVGGSLVPVGGHNLLEPAALGVPTLSGPHVFNAEDVAARLVDEQAVRIVADGAELGRAVGELLSDQGLREAAGERARRAVERNRGALGRLLALLAPVIEGADPAAAGPAGAATDDRAAASGAAASRSSSGAV